jgi:hypothetical protein
MNKFGSRDTDYEKVLNAITTCTKESMKQRKKYTLNKQLALSEEATLG